MGILDTPDWIEKYVAKWQKFLHLTQWRITSKMSLAPGDSTSTAAVCSQVQNIAEAHLIFRADAEPGQYWEETILHEILHIAHGHVDQAIYNVALLGMPQGERDKSYQVYCDAMEKFVDGLSKLLWQLEQQAKSSQETNQNEPATERRRIGFLPPKPDGASRGSGAGSNEHTG